MLGWAILHLASVLFASTVDSKGTAVLRYASGTNDDYDAALEFLQENDALTGTIANKGAIAAWNYASNLTEENKKEMLKSQAEEAKFVKETWKNATSFAWKDFKERNETIYRWFKKLAKLGISALPEDQLDSFNSLVADMQDIYSKAKVCAKDSPADKPCELSLEPELSEIFKKSRDYNELKHVWTDWRKITGRKMKSEFLKYVRLSNEAALLNGFKDAGEMWREGYESETFADDVEALWKEIEPFYKQLHAFVRKRLIERYPDCGIKPDGPIPAHLLGNMWAQSWGNIFDIVKPIKEKQFLDVSDRMRERKMTALDMFKMSEEFFTSLGLKPMTQEFWNRSIIEKPKDREIVCHASAWDFSDGKDFRIKMCTRINMEDLITVHHEMGHIQYDQQYAHQPAVFRGGANPGFHEAVGDVLALSVASSTHLKKIGLLDDIHEDEGMEINGLMKTALGKVAFLPFGYLIDSWRWKVFSGEFSDDQLNSKWWEQRLKYQGLCPPVRRTDEDLDAAAKYHVIADVPYIRYFVSHIIQFQFHKALCEAAGHSGPLHQCDIYQNKEAGKLLSDTLSLGSSVHWSEAMKVITRGKTDKMDAQPMIEYFEPLMKWLKEENEGETLGWKSIDPMMCPENHNIKHF
uniref:Angiotensin-converting enzyme n=1 Tax=Cupiennius salei TaxID=6928 RepID=A0A4Y5UGF3_CUPSA|nr:angiotensin-converting enzyme isoform 1 [Cupiennius salei]